MKEILVTYKSVITNKKYTFNITKYISKHPGEGIRNIYLKNFNGKDISSHMDRYHNTNEPFEILENIIKSGKSTEEIQLIDIKE